MALFNLTDYRGMAPNVDPELLPDNMAEWAVNCRFNSGKLDVFYKPVRVADIPVSNPKTIYYYNSRWLAWNKKIDIVPSIIPQDSYKRIYYTGDGAPKIRYVLNNREYEKTLGVSPPSSPVTATIEDIDLFTELSFSWGYYYEETDGVIKDWDARPLTVEWIADYSWQDPITGVQKMGAWKITVPARVAASSNAKFQPYANVTLVNRNIYIGRVYSDNSVLKDSTTAEVAGATLSLKVLYGQNNTECHVIVYSKDVKTASVKVAFRYVYTYVTELGEESAPSPPSEEYISTVLRRVRIEIPPVTSTHTGPAIVKRRIYRLVTAADGNTQYQYVAEVHNYQNVFYDILPDVALGEVLPSTDWLPPPEGLKGLVAVPGGFMAGFVGNTVYFSEPLQPHAWPRKYAYTVEYDIVGLGVIGNSVYVLTKGKPYLITLSHPANATVVAIASSQPCINEQVILPVGGGILYFSPDGIVFCSGASADVKTLSLIDKATWASWQPERMRGAIYDDCLYVSGEDISFILPLNTETGMFLSLWSYKPTAYYYDVQEDVLFFAIENSIYAWDKGDEPIRFLWKSKTKSFPIPVSPTTLQVRSESYPVEVSFWVRDKFVGRVVVANEEVRRLPVFRKERSWAIEVVGSGRLYQVVVGRGMDDKI